MSSSPLSPLVLPSRRAVAKSRRDFLAWLAAGTAVAAVGCSAETRADEELDTEGEGTDLALGTNEEEQTICQATTRDALGPYWEPGSPLRGVSLIGPNEPGVRLFLEGRMFGPDCTTPLAGYALDIWQADDGGNYSSGSGTDFRLRGKIKTDALGRYRVQTILPGRYADAAGIRPAHLHVNFVSPGGNVILTTQLYFQGDPYLGQADYCTRQGTCNSADPKRALKLRSVATTTGIVGKKASFDAFLPRT